MPKGLASGLAVVRCGALEPLIGTGATGGAGRDRGCLFVALVRMSLIAFWSATPVLAQSVVIGGDVGLNDPNSQ